MKNRLFLFVLMVFVVTGCSVMGPPKSDEEIVTQRGQEWLNALVKKDFKTAWGYTSPAFRSGNDVASYKLRVAGAADWVEAAVHSASCEESRCEVKYSIVYSLARLGVKNTQYRDNVWIKIDGKWWIYQK